LLNWLRIFSDAVALHVFHLGDCFKVLDGEVADVLVDECDYHVRLKLTMMLLVDVPMLEYPLARLCNLYVGVAIFIDALGCNSLVIVGLMPFLELRLLASDVKSFHALVPRLMTFGELRWLMSFLEPAACFCCHVLWSLMQLKCEGFGITLGD
jgi:hypothetical protein